MPTIIKTFTSSQGGVKNYLSTRSSSFSGWTNVGTGATGSTTTTAAELPELSVGTALKVTNGGSGSGYVESDFFQVDASDLGKLLGLTYNLETSTSPAYAASDLQIQVWDATTSGGTYAQNTTLNVANVPSSPTGGTMQLSFSQNPSRPFTRIRIVRVAGLANSWASFSSITVTSATGGQSAAISEWQSYTPTFESGISFGTAGSSSWYYRRVGSSLEIKAQVSPSGTGINLNGTSGYLTFTLPSGLTINTTQGASNQRFGTVQLFNATNNLVMGHLAQNASDTNKFAMTVASTATTGVSALLTTSLAPIGSLISINGTVPIAEWAGNGTVNLGPGAQVEYAADDGSSDVFGPNGALVPNLAASTGQTNRNFSFNYPQQATQDLVVQINYGGLGWSSAADLWPFSSGNNGSASNSYGVRGFWTSATNFRVVFGNRGTEVSASNVDNGITSWATEFAAGTRFRVAKANPSSPVGYGKANSTEFGLVAPRRGQQSLTFSSTPAGWSLVRAVGIYYQDQDGNHRLKFNIDASMTSATNGAFTISGVTFKNGFNQALTGMSSSAANPVLCLAASNTGQVTFTTGSSNTVIRVSGDVELESRPSWA